MKNEVRLAEWIGVPGLALAIVDVFSVWLASMLAALISGLFAEFEYFPDYYRIAVGFAMFAAPVILLIAGAYRAWRGVSLFVELRTLLFSWVFVFLLLAAVALATKMGAAFSRRWVFAWFLSGLLIFVLARVALRTTLSTMRRHGYDQKKIIVMGGGQLAKYVLDQLAHHQSTGLVAIGYFDDRDCGTLNDDVIRLGGFDDIEGYLAHMYNRGERIDQVWLAMPLSAENRLHSVVEQLKHTTIDLRLVPDIFGYQLLNHSVQQVAGLPVVNLSVSPMDDMNSFLKRCEDLLLGTLLMLVSLPAMLIITALIRLTMPGPVLFKQERHGWDGRPFQVYKFRTMRLHELADDGAVVQAQRNDDRVTPLGGWLRRLSLDELPQFFNVIKGDMSIVGPRPHAVEHNHRYVKQVDRYMLRHKVKPGITGWAQVNGLRGITDTLEKMELRVQYDLFYIENWSVWFDLKIIFLTVFKGFHHKNAF